MLSLKSRANYQELGYDTSAVHNIQNSIFQEIS